MSTVVGFDGLEGAPSLQSICDLYRSIVNDSFSGGAGQINTDAAPWMIPFLNSGIEDLYEDLGLVDDMRLIRDNFLINGIPPLAVGNPEVQVALTYAGYFNGSTWNNLFMLPPDLKYLKKVWQRQSNTGAVFCPMMEAPDGLYGGYQGSGMGQYEVRGNNELWFNGALLATDLRLRYEAVWQEITGSNVDFNTTYVPIQGSRNAIAFKMVAYYAQRLSPDQFQIAEAQAIKFTKKLAAKSVLNSQTKQFQRVPFEGNLTQV
jgi:hypothetical protein